MEEGAGFIGVNLKVVSFFVTEVHDSSCRAVLCRGELTGVAVREKSVAGGDEGERMNADSLTDVNVLFFYPQGFVPQEAADFRDGFSRCIFDDAFHAAQCP